MGTLALPPQEPVYDGNMTTSFNGDGAFLYYTLEISGGPNQTGPTLFRIDPTNLGITMTPLTGLPSRIIGAGFAGGVFYGFTDDGAIVQIDPALGATSVIGSCESGRPPGGGPPFTGVFGLVATPEPWTLLLSGLALGAVMVFRRRPVRLDARP